MSVMDPAEAWATLTRETTLSRQEWTDLLSLPEPALRKALATYAHADWTRPGTSAWTRVLQALPVIGQTLGIVSGVTMLVNILRGVPTFGGPP